MARLVTDSEINLDGAAVGQELELLDFESPHDVEHPHNWALLRRVWATFMLAVFNLVVTVASSIFGSAQSDMIKEFGVSEEITILGTSLFLIVCFLCLQSLASYSYCNRKLTILMTRDIYLGPYYSVLFRRSSAVNILLLEASLYPLYSA